MRKFSRSDVADRWRDEAEKPFGGLVFSADGLNQPQSLKPLAGLLMKRVARAATTSRARPRRRPGQIPPRPRTSRPDAAIYAGRMAVASHRQRERSDSTAAALRRKKCRLLTRDAGRGARDVGRGTRERSRLSNKKVDANKHKHIQTRDSSRLAAIRLWWVLVCVYESYSCYAYSMHRIF